MDLERKEWLQIFSEYMRLQKLAKQFVDGLSLTKGQYGYPLQGTNWSGLLGENGSPDCAFIDQIREAMLPI